MWFLFNRSDVQLSITVKITDLFTTEFFGRIFKFQTTKKFKMHNDWVVSVFYLFLGSIMMDFAQTTCKRKGLKSFIYFANCEVMSHVNHI